MADLDRALEELRDGLTSLYGPRLRRLILFGSQVRGDATEDSDIDVAVVLDAARSSSAEIEAMGEVVWPLCLRHSVVINLLPLGEEEARTSWEPVVVRVREEGRVA